MSLARCAALFAAILVLPARGEAEPGFLGTLKQKLGPASSRLAPARSGAATAETLDPASDALCDSLDRSYALTENLGDLAASQARCRVMTCAPEEIVPTSTAELEAWLQAYSERHVWLPVTVEAQLGTQFLDDQRSQGLVLDRGRPRTDKLYARVDQALAIARRAYPKIPYQVDVYLLDIADQVNAQASPGGDIFVTRAAAKDLGDDALQLVLGHEVAHLAKRHLSKQLQQRLLETGQAVSLFRSMARGAQAIEAKPVVDRLQCSFARYEQAQEAQADACAARAMVAAGADPVAAWGEYLRVRGINAPADRPTAEATKQECFERMSSHPDEGSREQNLRTAAEHHRDRTAARSGH